MNLLTEAEKSQLIDDIIEQDYDKSIAKHKETERFSPKAVLVNYDADTRSLVVALNNGITLNIPVSLLQISGFLSTRDWANVSINPMGDLYWAEAGEGLSVRSLLAGRFGSRKWMEKLHREKGFPLGEWGDSPTMKEEWAAAAGSAKSEAKKKAAQENGKKGGRPKKVKQALKDAGGDLTIRETPTRAHIHERLRKSKMPDEPKVKTPRIQHPAN